MSLKAYQNTQAIAEDPRATEYRLFGQVTSALIDVRDTGDKGVKLAEALDWNRRVWHVLASDCMSEGNQLPQALRAQIISISLWVGRYTRQVARNGEPIDALIEVNRTIMQGLQAGA
jgi:flagellar biosynthesis activator protein FlaF